MSYNSTFRKPEELVEQSQRRITILRRLRVQYNQEWKRLNQQFQMRNKHFSPDIVHFGSNLSIHSPSHARLKAVGSSGKLRTYNSNIIVSSERTIGNYSYDVSQEIGSGYSSKVYKGYSSRDNQECAIKVIQLKKYSEQSLKMLDNQIQILKNLQHPNVIKCYDIYKTSTHCFIITQLCSKGDLLHYLTRRGKLQESVAIEIMSQIIEGVKYLLKQGILHRDLKPANILHDKKNWKIADFGFSILSQKEIKTKYNVGTPLYMPLESLVKNIYSPSSDIFSVGVIFYELLTGITPWECKNEKELIKKMNSLPYCLAQRFKVSPGVRTLLQKLCSIEPAERLSKQQFLSLSLKDSQKGVSAPPVSITPSTLSPCLSSKLLLERSHSELDSQLLLKSSVNLFSSKSILSEKQINLDARQETRSNHILISQLHYCRFIYYLCRNVGVLLLSQKSKNKVTLIMYKHLLKLIKLLADQEHNWFQIRNWDKFRESKKYQSSLLTMKEYAARYEKEYLTFLRKNQINVVRDINKDLNELSSGQSFTDTAYRKIKMILSPIIREANHNTMFAVNEAGDTLNQELKGNIEGLRSLFKYYKLIELSMEEFENFQGFEKKSNIKVQIDYKNSPNATFEQLAELRKELKSI